MTELARFESFISPEPTSGCWLWTGGIQSRGYGFFCRSDGSMVLAHRFAVEEFDGRAIPAGHQIDHACRNKACVNPEHLDVVTGAENMRRRYRAARGEAVRGFTTGPQWEGRHLHDPERNRTSDLRLRNVARAETPQQKHGPEETSRVARGQGVHNPATMKREVR